MPLDTVASQVLDHIGEFWTPERDSLIEKDKKIPMLTSGELSALKGLAAYAKPRGPFEEIFRVIYRILNFVKAIFGGSDWQRAGEALTSFAMRFAPYCDSKTSGPLLQVCMDKVARDKILKFIVKVFNKTNKLFSKVDADKHTPFLTKLFSVLNVERISAHGLSRVWHAPENCSPEEVIHGNFKDAVYHKFFTEEDSNQLQGLIRDPADLVRSINYLTKKVTKMYNYLEKQFISLVDPLNFTR